MTTRLPVQPKDRHGFKIGIICALSLEAGMVEMVFDHRWRKKADGSVYGRLPNDPNTYRTGVIAGHSVVLGYCPGIGNVSAAQVASWMTASFTNVNIILVIGICGAVPSYTHQGEKEEIVLGDCLISTGVIQFDFGRKGPGGFAEKDGLDGLGRASTQIRTFLNMLQTPKNKQDLAKNLLVHLQALHDADPKKTKYLGADQDRLYKSTYIHTHQTPDEICEDCNVKLGICDKSCKDLACDDKQLEHRKKLDRDVTPSIHFGYFGSSSTVLKSGLERDELAKADNIIAFEMESAGIWEVRSTIVIKGACDYADSHKNKKWQEYAAAVAAAGLKAFLQEFEFPDDISQLEDESRYMIPFLKNRRFVGRESKLTELEQRLFADKETRQLAMFGLGGVGKTQLALAFCYAVKEKHPEYSIFWVSALSTERFKQDYVKIAKKCKIGAECNEEDLLQVVQDYLSSEKSGKWLLVVDNSDNKSILFNDDDNISDMLPQSEGGITLFTTRSKDIAVDVADGNMLGLHEMNLEEAKLFLKKSLRRNDLTQDVKIVEELLKELTYLPLAIAQASSYINKTSITISKYLDLMRSTEEEVIELLSREFRDSTREKGFRNAVAVTWLVSFELIRREEPNAADILFLLTFLENKAIPRSILPITESEIKLTDAIGILVGYSFLTEQANDETYDMHRLVHRAVKAWMQKEGVLDQWAEKTVLHLAEIFPSYHWENRLLWRQYTPHAIRVLQDTVHFTTERRADLCLSLGSCLEEDGRISEAAKWASEGVLWADQSLPEDNALRLYSQHLLAGVYIKNGQIKEAVDMLEKVVAIRTKVLAEDHPDRLASQHQLAGAYKSNGQIQKAVDMLEKVVTIKARVLAEDHPSRLASQHNLALAYESEDQFEEAISLMRYVVIVQEKSLRVDHPNRLTAEFHLSQMLSKTPSGDCQQKEKNR